MEAHPYSDEVGFGETTASHYYNYARHYGMHQNAEKCILIVYSTIRHQQILFILLGKVFAGEGLRNDDRSNDMSK